jgi:hypothetical protein
MQNKVLGLLESADIGVMFIQSLEIYSSRAGRRDLVIRTILPGAVSTRLHNDVSV